MASIKVRSKSLSLGIICALVLSGCGLLPSISLEPRFQADALVGADTWSFTVVTLRPSLTQAFRTSEVLDRFAGPAGDAGLDVRRVPTPSGRFVDLEKDVLPRLDGEVAVAASGPINSPRYSVLVHTNDIEGTLRLFAREAQPRFTKDARGVTHYESSEANTFVAGYKNWIVYASTAELRDQTLDRIDGKGGPSLASDGGYRSAVQRLSGDRLGFGYANLSPILQQSRFAAAPAFFDEPLENSGRVAYSFGFEDGPAAGVHVLGMAIEYIPETPRPGQSTGAGDALAAMDRLPKATMVAFAGPSFNIYAQSFDALGELTDEESIAGLQFILAQFAGPHALGVAAPTTIERIGFDEEDDFSNVIGRLIGGVFVIAQVAPDVDTAELAANFTSLADLVTQNEPDVGTWQGEVAFGEDWLAFNAVPAPAVLEDLPEDLLASDRLYQWTRRGFRQSGANMYVSLDAIQSIIAAQLPPSDELAAASLFRAIGLSSEVEEQGDVHAHLTILIAPQ